MGEMQHADCVLKKNHFRFFLQTVDLLRKNWEQLSGGQAKLAVLKFFFQKSIYFEKIGKRFLDWLACCTSPQKMFNIKWQLPAHQ